MFPVESSEKEGKDVGTEVACGDCFVVELMIINRRSEVWLTDKNEYRFSYESLRAKIYTKAFEVFKFPLSGASCTGES